MQKKARTQVHLEQLDLFTPPPERLRWIQIPVHDQTEIVKLLAELMLKKSRENRKAAGGVEVGHE